MDGTHRVGLLSAYALLVESYPDMRLVIAGGETLFDYQDYRAGDAAAAAHVRIYATLD